MADGTRLTRFKAGDYEFIFTFLQDWRDNFGELVPRTERLPGMSGGFDSFGDDPAPAEVGNVTASFALVSETQAGMTTLLDAMRQMTWWGKGRLFMQPADPNAAERWCWARLNNLSDPHSYSRHSDLFMRVQASFQAPDPRWYTQGTFPWAWGDGTLWGDQPWGGAATPHACSGLQTDFTVVRAGNAPVQPRITMTTSSGQTAEDVTIQRIVSGVVMDEMKYIGVLGASGTVDMNAWSMTVTLNGSSAYTTSFTTKYGHWFQLMPGSNTIRVKLKNSGDACSATVRSYEAWV